MIGNALAAGIKNVEEEEQRRARIAKCQERMTHDFAATATWVRRHYEREEGAADVASSPSSEAARFHAELAPIWQPSSLDPWNGEHLEGLENWFEANRSELNLPPIEAADLREAIRKNRGKAPGPDAWNAEHLVDAPDTFYRCLADLWSRWLQLSLLLDAWLCVRVTGIPKSDPGSLRPLSIESACQL